LVIGRLPAGLFRSGFTAGKDFFAGGEELLRFPIGLCRVGGGFRIRRKTSSRETSS
jgi:hypothetical protein